MVRKIDSYEQLVNIHLYSDVNSPFPLDSWVSKSVMLLIDFIGLLPSSMLSNNFLAMEVEFSLSKMLLSRSRDI